MVEQKVRVFIEQKFTPEHEVWQELPNEFGRRYISRTLPHILDERQDIVLSESARDILDLDKVDEIRLNTFKPENLNAEELIVLLEKSERFGGTRIGVVEASVERGTLLVLVHRTGGLGSDLKYQEIGILEALEPGVLNDITRAALEDLIKDTEYYKQYICMADYSDGSALFSTDVFNDEISQLQEMPLITHEFISEDMHNKEVYNSVLLYAMIPDKSKVAVSDNMKPCYFVDLSGITSIKYIGSSSAYNSGIDTYLRCQCTEELIGVRVFDWVTLFTPKYLELKGSIKAAYQTCLEMQRYLIRINRNLKVTYIFDEDTPWLVMLALMESLNDNVRYNNHAFYFYMVPPWNKELSYKNTSLSALEVANNRWNAIKNKKHELIRIDAYTNIPFFGSDDRQSDNGSVSAELVLHYKGSVERITSDSSFHSNGDGLGSYILPNNRGKYRELEGMKLSYIVNSVALNDGTKLSALSQELLSDIIESMLYRLR